MDDKGATNNRDDTTTINPSTTGTDELARSLDTHVNPVSSPSITSSIGATRTYSPPLMGTSARAAKRRADMDTGPIRIEGTDTYNQQLQHHYQNVRQILDDQQSIPTNLHDKSDESVQSFTEKREFFEQRFKTPPPTYDSPPRQVPTQKILTTITTTTTTAKPIVPDRASSSSNESPSVDRVLEQAVELQKLSHMSTLKTNVHPPVVIERTEQYQVFLDAANHEIRRTPSVSRTSLIPATRTGHATDLDQAQAQAERVTDDHQAIQQLTRVLQEHNQTTTTDFSSFSSDINPVSSPNALNDRPNLPIPSEFNVIDALLTNPIATTDEKSNNTLQWRYNDILSNIRNPEWLHSLKQSLPRDKPLKESKKKSKEKSKPKKKQVIEDALPTPLVNTSEQMVSSTQERVVANLSEQTPLIDPKDKKASKKENKTKTKTKTKPKPKGKQADADYQTIDAIISSPVSMRLPDSYLNKYKISPPLCQLSPIESIPPLTPDTAVPATTKTKGKEKGKGKEKDKGKEKAKATKDKNVPKPESNNETLSHLVKIVNELFLHHAAALTAATPITPSTANVTNKDAEIKTPTPTVINEPVHEQPLTEQANQTRQIPNETQSQSEATKPRIIYRYIDDQGNVLAVSSTPPSKLRDQPSQQYPYQTTEPALLYGRQIETGDERRHPLPQHEQRATWQGEPKLPTTVTREDFELRDKRVPHLSEQPAVPSRSIPVSHDNSHPSRIATHAEQQKNSHYPNQQNIKLAWLPLSYPSEQTHAPIGATGYETDSTMSERSTNYRPYEYGLSEGQYRQPNRPLYHNEFQYIRPQGPAYYPPPPPLPYHNRGLSPEYNNTGPAALSRNYLEVFRGGDFRDNKPSEIYSLPLTEHLQRSPLPSSYMRPSRYDQYQSEKYATMTNRRSTPSLQPNYYSNDARYTSNIPVAPTNVYKSSYYAHRSPPEHHVVQRSPNREYKNYIRHSKSFDYRPLRTKLQREYKITPNLLVDEWDYPSASDRIHYSTATSATNRSGVSSPDDVFLSNRTSID